MHGGIATAAAAGSMHPSRKDHAASGRMARGSMHAMALPGRGMASSSHAGTSAQGLTDAGRAEPDAAALGQQPLAHGIAHSVRDKAAHARQEQPAQAGHWQGGGLGGPSAASERSASASRWAAFQSCGGAAHTCGPVSGLQRACAAQPGPPEGANHAFSELEGLSVQRLADVRAAPERATCWDGVPPPCARPCRRSIHNRGRLTTLQCARRELLRDGWFTTRLLCYSTTCRHDSLASCLDNPDE